MLAFKSLAAAMALGAALFVAPSPLDARVTTAATSVHRSSTLSIKHKAHRKVHRKHGVKHAPLHAKTTKPTTLHAKTTKPATHAATATRHHPV